MNLIGRKSEITQLRRIKDSKESEFVMVYGRRRVGKTHLIREFFGNKFDFHITGIACGSYHEQLSNFRSVMYSIDESIGEKVPANWWNAFEQLKMLLLKSRRTRKVIFLDEVPWIDTPRSEFVKALEHFWNSWASARKDIILVVCGSAASWMVKHIVRNRGGLHNRLTMKIKLSPFTLSETREYLRKRGIRWNERAVAECYMALGGIPYYLRLLDRTKSLAQNIDMLFFNQAALLGDEFNNLYASLFRNSEEHVRIVSILAQKRSGHTRKEIIEALGVTDGGSLTRRLDELEQCEFIRRYKALGNTRYVYQLTDFYTLFYFNFIAKGPTLDENQWENMLNTSTYNTWCGLSFERLCFAHLPQIKKALGISGIATKTYSYRDTQVQIDMVIERADKFVSMCEMKYTSKPYSISKAYAEQLDKKAEVLSDKIKNARVIQTILVTSSGLKNNDYSINRVVNCLILSDLFD